MTLAELIRQDALKESGLTPEVKEELAKGIYKALRASGSFSVDVHDIEKSRVDYCTMQNGEKYSIVRLSRKDDYAFKSWLREQGLSYEAVYGARGIHLIRYKVML